MTDAGRDRGENLSSITQTALISTFLHVIFFNFHISGRSMMMSVELVIEAHSERSGCVRQDEERRVLCQMFLLTFTSFLVGENSK